MTPAFALTPPEPEPLKPARKKNKRAVQRSMELLREQGFLVGKVEYWLQFRGMPGRLIDLFGFIDLVVLDPENKKIIAVQVTKGDLPAHIEKIRATKAARTWLECGGEIWIHLWTEKGPKYFKEWVLESIAVEDK